MGKLYLPLHNIYWYYNYTINFLKLTLPTITLLIRVDGENLVFLKSFVHSYKRGPVHLFITRHINIHTKNAFHISNNFRGVG